MPVKYSKKAMSFSKNLRKNMTKQEKHLWYDFLCKYPIKFQRQKAIDNYIVDFYCHSAKLVVEIDGSQHYLPEDKEYDKKRTEILSEYGLCVLRFTNFDINDKFNGVCFEIDKIVKSRIPE